MLNIVDRKPSSLNELCKLYKHKTQRLGVKKKEIFHQIFPYSISNQFRSITDTA